LATAIIENQNSVTNHIESGQVDETKTAMLKKNEQHQQKQVNCIEQK